MSNSKGFTWWVERAKIGIAKTSDYGVTFTSPTEVLTVRVFCSKLADHFSIGAEISLAEESDIPEIFHDALISKVNSMVYEKTPEGIQLAQYWEGKYRESIHEAKKYGNDNRVMGAYVKGEDY
tara:strand:- start:165 stop:533 length:369 start_codon:yes stop_codon:yes gene_type:complete